MLATSDRTGRTAPSAGVSILFLVILLWLIGGPGLGRPAGNLGALGSSVEAATTRAKERMGALEACRTDGYSALALTITAGEDALRNSVERAVEDLVVLAGLRLDLSPPDISFGPAQIRPAHYLKLRGSMAGFWETVATPCASIAFVDEWVITRNAAADQAVNARRSVYADWSGYPPYDPLADRFFEIAAYYDYCEKLYRYATRRLARAQPPNPPSLARIR